MIRQCAHTVLMIRPSGFGFNPETSVSNIFQQQPDAASGLQEQARVEFEGLVDLLRRHGIDVWVYEEAGSEPMPDAVFPNNWLSFHDDKIVVYPLLAESRRAERSEELLQMLRYRTRIRDTEDFSSFEDHGLFLEGTGSLVLDRVQKTAYANLSSRTHAGMADIWCQENGYERVMFTAITGSGQEIYHTNVLLSIGETQAVVCSGTIRHTTEREAVLSSLRRTHDVMEISEEQMRRFCGNLLQLQNREGQKYWVMSTGALAAFRPDQLKWLEQDARILHSPLHTIETVGGGGARCMMAEVFYGA